MCADLARQLIADAEGADHDIAIEVRSTPPARPTRSRSRAPIARNNLFKCAIFGNDPNWGRVLAAVGTTAGGLRPGDARRRDQRRTGVPRRRSRRADRSWSTSTAREVHVVVDLHAGDETATVWTNDLTHDYVHENSAYST